MRRAPTEAAVLRRDFNNSVRKNFLINLAKTPDAISRFNSEDILRMSNGTVPKDYNVHHKLPLDDSGTNTFDNLVLIGNEPYHKIFTNMQSTVIRGMLPGESKVTPWAIPSGSIYPLK
ncbi:TPA: HNH endonuclease [Citrobacter koseri]|nr:HNH endonuclease [Citrobacter koseri]